MSVTENIPEKIAIPNMHGFDMISAKEIVRFEANGSYTIVFLSSGKKIIASKAINHFSEQWGESLFFRTHRSHLINISHIIRYHNGSNAIVEMSDGSSVPIARKEKGAFLKLIKIGATASPKFSKKNKAAKERVVRAKEEVASRNEEEE